MFARGDDEREWGEPSSLPPYGKERNKNK